MKVLKFVFGLTLLLTLPIEVHAQETVFALESEALQNLGVLSEKIDAIRIQGEEENDTQYAKYQSPDEKGNVLTQNTIKAVEALYSDDVSQEVRDLLGAGDDKVRAMTEYRKNPNKVAITKQGIYDVQQYIVQNPPRMKNGSRAWGTCIQPTSLLLDGYFGRETKYAIQNYIQCYEDRFPVIKEKEKVVINMVKSYSANEKCNQTIFDRESKGVLTLGSSLDLISGCEGTRPKHLVGVDYQRKTYVEESDGKGGTKLVESGAVSVNNLQGDVADITFLIQRIINIITALVASVAVFFVVKHGFALAMSLGNEDDISEAKKGLSMSLGGLVVIILAYVIVRTVISITFAGNENDRISMRHPTTLQEQKISRGPRLA